MVIEELRIAKYEVVLEVGEQGLHLPPYKGSTLRGGFGRAFQRIACAQRDKSCKQCLLRTTCPYAYIFETAPPPGAEALRNYESVPRPFLLEPPLERKTIYAPGDKLQFGLALFGKAVDYLPYFILAFRELGEMGIGKGRKKYSLRELLAVNPLKGLREVVYCEDDKMVRNVDLSVRGKDIPGMDEFIKEFGCSERGEFVRIDTGRLAIEYQTMTRIKFEESYTRKLEFHILIRNLLRRLSSLVYFHHGEELELDFVELIERAKNVRIVEDHTRWVDWERFSSRQDKKINLGGLVGKVLYEGDVNVFLPLVKLAELVHVGKGAVFGMGKIKVM